MKNLKLAHKFIGGFLIVALIAAFIGFYAIYSISKLKQNTLDIGRIALPSVVSLGDMQLGLQMIWVAERGLTNNRMRTQKLEKLSTNI